MINKILLVFSLLLSSLLVQRAVAQPTGHYLWGINTTDSCHVANSLVTVSGLVLEHVVGDTVKVYWGDGTDTAAVFTQPYIFKAQHTYAFQGTYSVKLVLLDTSNAAIDSSFHTVSSFCNTLNGTVHISADNNCTYDPGAGDLHTCSPIEIELRKNNIPEDTFSTYGYFSYSIPSPDQVSEYSLHPLVAGTSFNPVCPALSYEVRLDTLTSSDSVAIALECNPAFTGYDLAVHYYSHLRTVNLPPPAYPAHIVIYARNSACTFQDGTVTLNLSPKYTYLSSSKTPATINGNTITWNVNNLSAKFSYYENIYVFVNPVGNLSLGDTAINTVSIVPTANDVNLSNNVFTKVDTIRNSYDPNEKEVMPAGDISAGEWLTYTIHFENLGNDTAFNIHILDTLSDHLDVGTMKLLGSSHPVSLNLFHKGNYRIARFDFAHIMLPDKSDSLYNKGYVRYRVKANNNMNAGDKIANTAHIYFDVNPAVVTNTVVSKIPLSSSVGTLNKQQDVQVFPNPSDGNFTIHLNLQGKERGTAELWDVHGRLVQKVSLDKNETVMSCNGCVPGVYYYRVLVEGMVVGKGTLSILK